MIRWSEKAISQLGYSINLFTTVGISFLTYLITNKEKFPKYSSNGEFSFVLTLYLICLFFIFISVLFGFISILSRLFDFRITRHLSFIRKKHYKKHNKTSGLSKDHIIDISKENSWKIFYKTVFKDLNLISQKDLDSNNVSSKFEQLRIASAVLGNLTWKMHKYQICILLFSSLIYGITIFV